jgi:hypothetical protein
MPRKFAISTVQGLLDFTLKTEHVSRENLLLWQNANALASGLSFLTTEVAWVSV